MRGVVAYSPHPTVAIVDSGRAGETYEQIPIVASVEEGLAFEPDTALVGVATQGGRFPPAWRELLKESIAAGLARRERAPRVPERRPRDGRAGEQARSRAPRPPQAAARPERADRGEPPRAGQDRADRRLRLRDRQEDGRNRAGPSGPRSWAEVGSSSRPARPGSRSPAGASPSTRSWPTSWPAQQSGSSSRARGVGERCSSSKARARSCIPPTRA